MGSLLGRIGNCGQPSGLLGFSLQAQPDAHALSTSRASFNYRSWWIMNRKSLKQMSLSDPGLLAAQRGKRLWAKLGNPCFHGSTASSTVNPVEPVEAFGDQSDLGSTSLLMIR